MADLLPDLAADRAKALGLFNVSRETSARLDRFVELLLTWQNTTNLVAPSTIPTLWTRHIADSLQLLDLAPDAKIWIDLGSGGGFPGVVLACALAGRKGARVHLVESNAKKAAFLRETVRTLGLPGDVHAGRIEDYVERFHDRVDIVTARALAPLKQLLAYAEPLIRAGATGLFLKGQDVDDELTDATKYWTMTGVRLIPSRTDPHGRIVAITGIEPKANKTYAS